MPRGQKAVGRQQGAAGDLDRALGALAGTLPEPALGIVLGSGLGGFCQRLSPCSTFAYASLPGFPRCRVPGHPGRLHTGFVGGRPVVVFEGRVHLYEGATVAEVTFASRLLAATGARALVLTSAAGAINPEYVPGDLMLVADHINLTGGDPARLGRGASGTPVFPDRSQIYDSRLLDCLSEVSSALGIRCQRGVLAGVTGPSYESPAEVRALRALGADAVCMSTVLEAMAASGAGLKVAGVLAITNRAGESQGASHASVLAAAARVGEDVARLLAEAVPKLFP